MDYKGMKGSELPDKHWEKDAGEIDCGNLKYAGEYSNPEELKRSADKLVDYVEKHQPKR